MSICGDEVVDECGFVLSLLVLTGSKMCALFALTGGKIHRHHSPLQRRDVLDLGLARVPHFLVLALCFWQR